MTKPKAWRSAAVSVLAMTAMLWLWSISDQFIGEAWLFSVLFLAADIGVAVLFGLIATAALRLVVRSRGDLPWFYVWSLLASFALLLTLGAGASPKGWIVMVTCALAAASWFGVALWSLVHHGRTAAVFGGVSVPVLVVAGMFAWLMWSGQADSTKMDATAGPLSSTIPRFEAPDPSRRGVLPVAELTYGSGRDKSRPEYGTKVDIKTGPVDGSLIVGGWHGLSGAARTSLWGFDSKSLPLNGRVWYPEQPGKYPLVVMLHGNNSAVTYSDQGLAYLGSLLASQGFVVASVDESFFNTGLIDKAGGLSGVNAARGWLLLEHLRVWRDWQTQSGNPLAGKVDMESIALLGHSRGGEAVAVAADLNTRGNYPENKDLRVAHGFDIRTVIAIAPSDGQYKPGGQDIRLKDVNYLALQGSHDADVVDFGGQGQYDRTDVHDGQIKAAVYIRRANHSQFNTAWGSHDIGQGLPKYFIRTAGLLKPEEQQHIAQVYVSAFLQSTLRGKTAYQPLFKDYRAGDRWLPDTGYNSRFADGSVAYGQPDVAGSRFTASVDGRSASTDERQKPLYLLFDAADTRPPRRNLSPLRYSVELHDQNGRTVRIDGPDKLLRTPVSRQYLKTGWLQGAARSQPVVSTHSLPLKDALQFNPDIDLSRLRQVSIMFDDWASSAVIVKNISLAEH